LIVMGSMAQAQETRSGGQTSAISAKLQENISNDGEFSSPVVIKVPIKLVNNSTKIAWSSPGGIPTFVVAGITNNGKLNMDVTVVSLSSDSKERNWMYAGEILPEDGLVVFGRFVELWIKCQNSTTKQYCTGTLETATWIPQ